MEAPAESAGDFLWALYQWSAGHILGTMAPYPGNKPAILRLVPFVIDMLPRLLSAIAGLRSEMLIASRGRHGKKQGFLDIPSQARL